MRQGRRARWIVGVLGGLAAVVATTGGRSSGCDCSDYWDAASDQTVSVQVMRDEGTVPGVEVTAWVIDVDTLDRQPIVAGTALTDGEGMVEFTYIAQNQPYVCGYEVRDATSKDVLARSPAAVSNHLSNPSGHVTVALP